MIKIGNVQTFGFEGAIRGMRNPYMSHEKSDSGMASNIESEYGCPFKDGCFHEDCEYCTHFCIGKAYLELCNKLIKAGPEHRKFLRMIHVQCDVLAPRYWWAEMDKYKYVEANSSSTIHLITKRKLTLNDFSYEEVFEDELIPVINRLDEIIVAYQLENDKEVKESYFKRIKRILPESYNQLRTIDTNYECLLTIWQQRWGHRLTEWEKFCEWIYSLPYMSKFIGALND